MGFPQKRTTLERPSPSLLDDTPSNTKKRRICLDLERGFIRDMHTDAEHSRADIEMESELAHCHVQTFLNTLCALVRSTPWLDRSLMEPMPLRGRLEDFSVADEIEDLVKEKEWRKLRCLEVVVTVCEEALQPNGPISIEDVLPSDMAPTMTRIFQLSLPFVQELSSHLHSHLLQLNVRWADGNLLGALSVDKWNFQGNEPFGDSFITVFPHSFPRLRKRILVDTLARDWGFYFTLNPISLDPWGGSTDMFEAFTRASACMDKSSLQENPLSNYTYIGSALLSRLLFFVSFLHVTRFIKNSLRKRLWILTQLAPPSAFAHFAQRLRVLKVQEIIDGVRAVWLSRVHKVIPGGLDIVFDGIGEGISPVKVSNGVDFWKGIVHALAVLFPPDRGVAFVLAGKEGLRIELPPSMTM
ncbi:hypothetical protein DL96DRAFT_1705126 [Flagelloscypha sp. PMI_526]|nr:hypothetical protein DL96DRAFT_1705126 [Flagelloscypha sp. PMI_526]